MTSASKETTAYLVLGATIASAIAWLLDPENSWVTGQVIGVDGGLGSLKVMAR